MSGRYVSYAKKITKTNPELAQEIRDGKKNIKEAIHQIQNEKRLKNQPISTKRFHPQKHIQIVCADYYQWCNENIKNNSIDLIITKPPNTKNDNQLWENLAEVSTRILKTTGFLISFCNQRYLDQFVNIFSKQLHYHWIYCINPNGHPVINDNNTIIEKLTPILVYSKRPLNKKDHSRSFTIEDDSDPFEQSIQYLLSSYSEQNDLVLDPFLGNGEVLRVSKELKRRYIGIDADSDRVEIAKGLSLC